MYPAVRARLGLVWFAFDGRMADVAGSEAARRPPRPTGEPLPLASSTTVHKT